MSQLGQEPESSLGGRPREQETPHQEAAGRPPVPALFDLTGDLEITYRLLQHPRRWRQRHVTEIVLRDSDHVDVSASYQILLPVGLARDFRPDVAAGDSVRLFVPFSSRPKQLLFDVDFAGPGGAPASLLLREAIARIQAGYLARLNLLAGCSRDEAGSILSGISAFTKANWLAHMDRTKPGWGDRRYPDWEDAWRTEALVSYLNDDLSRVDTDRRQVTRWLRQLEPARQALVDALGEGENSESASECLLLAVPFMELEPNRKAAIDAYVACYVKSVLAMSEPDRRILAECGRRWHAIVETVVPVGTACTIKMSEQRPWSGRSRRKLRQEIAFGDAQTTHVEIRAADTSIEISRPRITGFGGNDIGAVDETRQTPGAAAMYSSESKRPDNALVAAEIHPGRGYLYPFLFLCYPLALLTGLAMFVLPGGNNFVSSLALTAVPLTLIGGFVLSREPTALAQRLVRPYQLGLAVLLVAIWGILLGRLAWHLAS